MKLFKNLSAFQRQIISMVLPSLAFLVLLLPQLSQMNGTTWVAVALFTMGAVLGLMLFDRASERNAARKLKTLEVCQANVMIADNDFNIVFVNSTVQQMLKDNETTLKTVLPKFNADQLVGTNVDTFHKNPSHQRGMVGSLTEVYDTDLKVAGLTFGLIATPLFSDSGERLGTVVEWEDKTEALARREEEQLEANENARIKQALDKVTANTMIADNEGVVAYMNESVNSMLSHAQNDIRTDLPNFESSTVVGSNFDIFHKNPAHQRNMISQLNSTYRTEIVVGGRTFSLIANPVTNDEGDRIGTVVEWNDRTEEVRIEREIQGMINSVSRGKLDTRIDDSDKSGFFKNLADGLNELVGVTQGVIDDNIRVFDALAHGNLNVKIDKEYEGDFAKLKQDANATVDRLIETVTSIMETAHAVSSGSNEIAQGNADLSQRTEEQASSLEETASSMEEMTSTVKQSSDNANQANELAEAAKGNAQEGGDVVKQAVHAMEAINDSSKKINDIISVIDEIAFQTNLLALNAAVEAARAGEQGRGFAVVAGEVRSLAQRSAGAAKEIKDLIRDSSIKVEDGTSLVNKSGETLETIVHSIQEVSVMVNGIAIAAREQTSGIEQVNSAVGQMDEMTQQNAALVEESSAASESLSEQSNQLMELISFFQLDASTMASMGTKTRPQSTQNAPRNVVTKTTPSTDQDLGDGEQWEEF
jgi:methyl-accepting chemotaxis protein